jgi:hypothetical protein
MLFILLFNISFLTGSTLSQSTLGTRAEYYDFILNATSTEDVTDGTNPIVFTFTVINTGNQQDTYSLETRLVNVTDCAEPDPEEWTYSLDKTLFVLEPAHSQVVKLTVESGCTCQEGCIAEITVTVESLSNNNLIKSLEFFTTRGKGQPPVGDPGISIDIDYDPASTVLSLISDNIIPVRITNTQNTADNVNVFIASSPENWLVTLTPEGFKISANSKKTIALTINIPIGTPAGTHKITINAQSQDSPSIHDQASIKIPVKGDVIVDDLKFSRNGLNVDEKVKITVTIENIGLAAVDNITLALYDDINQTKADELKRFYIELIPANAKKTINYSWVPENEGDGNIVLLLDPDHTLDELHGENNRRVEPITVEPALDKSEGDPDFYYAFILIFVLIIIWLVIYYGRRSRSKNEPGNIDQSYEENDKLRKEPKTRSRVAHPHSRQQSRNKRQEK